MTAGGFVHFAPSGGFGMSMFQVDSCGTNMLKPIHLLSGDHRRSAGAASTRVTCVVAPVWSIQRTNTCDRFGSPSAR
jgi:hypothetical protein